MVRKETKPKLLLALLVAAAAALLVAHSDLAAIAATNDTITLTSPNNITIPESDDYATQVLGDPWDMNNLEDLDQPYDYTQAQVSNGVWSATTRIATGATAFLQYQNYPNGYSYIGEKDGPNYPVDSNRFSRLWLRMNTAQAGQSLLWFFHHLDYTSAGNSNFFQVQPGWHIYSIDLRLGGGGGNGNWIQSGPYEGLRLDAPWGANNNLVQYDWIRLTPNTGTPVNIAWNYTGAGTNRVNLYLSTSPNAASGNEYQIANVAASDGSYNWTTTGVAPGTYYIHAEMSGAVSSSGPLYVNTSPLLRLDAPSPLSGEDFAQRSLNTAWNGSNCGQFQSVRNVANLTCAGQIQGVPTTNDPQLLWLNGDYSHAIDTSRYRYMNVRMLIFPPAERLWAPFNAGPRLLWYDSGTWYDTFLLVAPYNQWIPAAWDMRNVPLEGGGVGWSGAPATFRFDPLEEDVSTGAPDLLPAGFLIDNSHLMTEPYSGPGTMIRWTPLQGAGSVDLFWDHDKVGYDGTPIATGVPLSQGLAAWDTSALANGSYYVYAIAHDSLNSSRLYSLVPLVVNHSSPSTLFTDVPTNYWAVDDINRLALRGIVSGVRLADTTVTFAPGGSAYRSHLSKMTVLAAGWTLNNPSTPTFHDVPVGSTFYQFIETAAAHNVISGYPCGGPGEPCDSQSRRYFRPSNNVTRAQTTKMIVISRGWSIVTPSSSSFADVPTTDGLFGYVETAFAHGIISGYPCGGASEPCGGGNLPYFRPGNSVTRAQLSKMLSRALDSLGPSK
jgi:hypothetical protein